MMQKFLASLFILVASVGALSPSWRHSSTPQLARTKSALRMADLAADTAADTAADSAPRNDYAHEVFNSVAVSGVVSKESNFASIFVFNNLFATKSIGVIKALTDDVAFARKRIVSPKTVYSGLFDAMQFTQIVSSELETYKEALKESEVWVAFNVSSSMVDEYSAVAAECGVKRVVFGVCMDEEQRGTGVTFDTAQATLSNAGIMYTIIKYAAVAAGREALQPYRIVRDELALPNPTMAPLSCDDLFRVMSETVDLPKTYNTVYGIGPGSAIDSEILVFMKSRGWPERVQVGMLMGDIMERIEKQVEAENARTAEERAVRRAPKETSEYAGLGEGNKNAGFFS
ncbi:hypothetical protein B484DRAFT_448549 [Ochromonadaceae sp. CCMP2298]|nr:hypothetical protein B484DRAFT_448549 [Ochromonadaceae sp. CCMP2298]